MFSCYMQIMRTEIWLWTVDSIKVFFNIFLKSSWRSENSVKNMKMKNAQKEDWSVPYVIERKE